jgi:hypothetical protein
VKAAGSDARLLPRGAALARMTGVSFQGRKTALPFAKAIFREGGRGVLDLGDWGVARTSLCVKKCQLGRLMDRYALAGVEQAPGWRMMLCRIGQLYSKGLCPRCGGGGTPRMALGGDPSSPPKRESLGGDRGLATTPY